MKKNKNYPIKTVGFILQNTSKSMKKTGKKLSYTIVGSLLG